MIRGDESESSMTVARDIMTRSVISIHERDSVRTAIDRLLAHGISGLPVVDLKSGRMVGIVTEYDLIIAMQLVGSGLDVRAAMKTGVLSVTETTPIEQVADLMLTHMIRRVPVVNDDGQPVGIVSRRDILRSYYAEG